MICASSLPTSRSAGTSARASGSARRRHSCPWTARSTWRAVRRSCALISSIARSGSRRTAGSCCWRTCVAEVLMAAGCASSGASADSQVSPISGCRGVASFTCNTSRAGTTSELRPRMLGELDQRIVADLVEHLAEHLALHPHLAHPAGARIGPVQRLDLRAIVALRDPVAVAGVAAASGSDAPGNRSASDSRSASATAATAPMSSPSRCRRCRARACDSRAIARWRGYRPTRTPRRSRSRAPHGSMIHLPEIPETAPRPRQHAAAHRVRARVIVALAGRIGFLARRDQPRQGLQHASH